MQTESSSVTGTAESTSSGGDASRLMSLFFRALVLALVFFNFSENTADPDLWGHTLFGQEMIMHRALDKAEPYAWTTHHGPWINHEVLAEVALGASHFLLGGMGLWLLTMVVGLATFAIALRMGLRGIEEKMRALAWAFGALAVVEIAFGFAARPQIFTALAMAVLFWLLRQIHDGKLLWAVALPILFLTWINTHGGALAGIVLLFGTAGATTLQFLWHRFRNRNAHVRSQQLDTATMKRTEVRAPSPQLLIALWVSFAFSLGALFVNPWGRGLVQWLIESVSWYRPEIQEWNPTKLGWDHGPMFAVAGLSVIAFAFSRRQKQLWEIGICAVLAIIAFRSVRHTPLFSIAALAFVPPHLANVLFENRRHFERLQELFSQTATQKFVSFLLVAACAGVLFASFTLKKERPFTMEAPRDQYPVAAVKFIKQNEIKGNMLAFFDWGEMVLWELPDCSPSIDGRLDTCYSRELIKAHWNFYNGEWFDSGALDISKADLALLPANLVGAVNLSKTPGWKAVYADPLAVILVRDSERYPKLAGINLPVLGTKKAVTGREAFPATNPRLQLQPVR